MWSPASENSTREINVSDIKWMLASKESFRHFNNKKVLFALKSESETRAGWVFLTYPIGEGRPQLTVIYHSDRCDQYAYVNDVTFLAAMPLPPTTVDIV